MVGMASCRLHSRIFSELKKPGPKAGKYWLWDVYKALHKAVMFGI